MSGLPKKIDPLTNTSLENYKKAKAELSECRKELRLLKYEHERVMKQYAIQKRKLIKRTREIDKANEAIRRYKRLDIVMNGGQITKELNEND